MKDDGRLAVRDGDCAVYTLPDLALYGVEFLALRRALVTEEEDKLRHDSTQPNAKEHEKLVQE